VLASIEYGVSVLGAPLLVVLGHDSCGAILATLDTIAGRLEPGPGLTAIIDRVTPSINTAAVHGVTAADDIAAVHVERTMDMITERTALAAPVAAGTCGIVGLTYRLADGRVTLAGSRPRDLAEPGLVRGNTSVDAVG
jgi:carbonic anhydrase